MDETEDGRITETITFHFDNREQQRRFHDRLNDPNDWKHLAKNGLAKCTPEHSWAEWVADRNAEIERLTAEISRLRSQGGAPEGWRLVPVEPTDDMAEIARDWAQRAWRNGGDPKGYLKFHQGIYRAMLSAAPMPPVRGSLSKDLGAAREFVHAYDKWRAAADALANAFSELDDDDDAAEVVLPFTEAEAAAECELIKARAALISTGGDGARDVCAEMRARCEHCGGTGDVHRMDGEWLGRCTCEYGQALKAGGPT